MWEMMLWLSVSIIKKTKLHWILKKGTNLGLKCVRMRLAAGLRPDLLWELQRSPNPLAAIRGGCLLLKGGKGREWEKGRKGWEVGKEGGKGKGGPPSRIGKSAKVATLFVLGTPALSLKLILRNRR